VTIDNLGRCAVEIRSESIYGLKKTNAYHCEIAELFQGVMGRREVRTQPAAASGGTCAKEWIRRGRELWPSRTVAPRAQTDLLHDRPDRYCIAYPVKYQ